MFTDSNHADSLDVFSSCFVFASAGSGKTKTLVDRFVKQIFFGILPHEILCITFTNAAAFEMQNRISKLLEELYINKDGFTLSYIKNIIGLKNPTQEDIKKAEGLFFKFLDSVPRLKIQTIHGMCQNLLRRYPLEANVSMFFKVIDDTDAKRLLQKSKLIINDTCNFSSLSKLMSIHTFEELVSKLDTLTPIINDIIYTYGSIDDYQKYLQRKLCVSEPLFFSQKQLDFIKSHFKDESIEDRYITKSGTLRKKIPFQDNPISLEIANILQENITNDKKNKCIDKTISFLKVAELIIKEYNERKSELNVLDYSDILNYTKHLLTQSTSKEFVLSDICGRIKSIMIDEAQDLSAIQWHIVSLVAEDILTDPHSNKTLFVVGDIKQSIYRFQGANCKLFVDFYKECKYIFSNLGKKLNTVSLTKNYRTLPNILNNVDKIFEGKVASYAFYNSLIPYSKHTANRKESDGVFEYIDSNCDLAEDINNISYHILNNPSNDILILSRSRTELSNQLMKRLEEIGCKIAPPDRINLHDSFMALDMLSLMELKVNFCNKYYLGCILKSPYIFTDPLSNSDIKKIFLYDNYIESFKTIYQSYYNRLISIIEPYSSMQLKEFAFSASRQLKKFDSYDEYILQSFLDIVMRFSENNTNNIEDFLDYFKEGKIEVSNQTSDRNVVRFSTIHGAKGLEAECVYLLPFETKPNQQKLKFIIKDNYSFLKNKSSEPLFLIKPSKQDQFYEVENLINEEYEEEEKELWRLLYVALTRPRDAMFTVIQKQS